MNESSESAVGATSVGSRPTLDRSDPVALDSMDAASRRGAALQHAAFSALIPGAAQLAQGRWVAALAQFGVVVAYLLGVFAAGPKAAMWLAVLWNAYSAVDTYWYERS